MIVGKIKRKMPPATRRRAAATLGLALAVALRRVGSFENVEVRAWRGVPDVMDISGERVDVELRLDRSTINEVANRLKKWDGVTVMLSGRLGRAELRVEIDIYAGDRVPVQSAITHRGIDVLAEPKGYVGDKIIESFYDLFDEECGEMWAFVREFTTEMRKVELKTVYAGTRTYPLWELVTWVYMLRNYSFEPDSTVPLWISPHLTKFFHSI
jgi:hypothetical protein